MRLYVVVLFALLFGCDTTSSPGFCSPAGFTTCSGNELVTCVGMPGQDGGTPQRVDCTATGEFCLGTGFDTARCGPPELGETCSGRDTRGCGTGDQLLRCVWVSETPEPGLSGDIGVWRVETDCTATSQVCTIGAAACSAP